MTKRSIKFSVLFLAGLLAASVIAFQISKSRTFQFFGEIFPRVETQQKVVALTFDDGPQPGAAEEIISILAEQGVKATFYLIGDNLEKNMDQGRKLVAAGHEIGNHSYSHDRMFFKTPSFIKSEIERTDQLIRLAGYRGEINFRPPFGKKLVLLPYYLSQNNRRTITWDVEPESYSEIDGDADKIVNHVLKEVKPGSIVLLHVMYKGREQSMKSVRGIITGLKSQGYSFKTVSELLALNNA